MKKLAKICILTLCILIPSTIQVLCKNEGIILGGVPTLLLFAPFAFVLGKLWGWSKKKNIQEEKADE